jgi:hypothetical protein
VVDGFTLTSIQSLKPKWNIIIYQKVACLQKELLKASKRSAKKNLLYFHFNWNPNERYSSEKKLLLLRFK